MRKVDGEKVAASLKKQENAQLYGTIDVVYFFGIGLYHVGIKGGAHIGRAAVGAFAPVERGHQLIEVGRIARFKVVAVMAVGFQKFFEYLVKLSAVGSVVFNQSVAECRNQVGG